MADNLLVGAIATGVPAGTNLGALKGTLSGDADAQVGPVVLMNAVGAEGSWVFSVVPLPAALGSGGGVPVSIVGDAVGSAVATDNGTVAAGAVNNALVIGLPYMFDGAAWVRGGFKPHHKRAAATNNATSLKATAGIVGAISAFNRTATKAYLKFYDKATAPSPGSDTPVWVVGIPASTDIGGSNLALPPQGLCFLVGVAYAIVLGEGETDNTSVGTAGDIHVNVGWI